MSIQQLIYTSCQQGMTGRAGFQVYSMSNGITEVERSEIESHCVYIPPVDFPSQPTEEEIAALFPKTLSYFQLSSGRLAVASIVYAGKDYSGRFGNYFCHVLVFDQHPTDLQPIMLYGSEDFQLSLKGSTEVEALSTISNVKIGSEITKERMIDFAIEHREQVITLLHHILQANSNNKRIVFSSDQEDLPRYIGAVQLLLPASLTRAFSFTTYTQKPVDATYFISGVIEKGARFSTFSIENHQDCVYVDLNRFDAVEQVPLYLRVLKDSLMSEDRTKVNEFISFIEDFRSMSFDTMEQAAKVYFYLMEDRVEELTPEQLSELLTFAKQVGSVKVTRNLVDQLLTSTEKKSIAYMQVLVPFMLKVAFGSDDKDLQDKTVHLGIQEMVQSSLSQGKLEQFVDQQRKIIPEEIWAKSLLDDRTMMSLIDERERLPFEQVQYYGKLFLECMVTLAHFEVTADVKYFVRDYLSSSNLSSILSVLNNDRALFPDLLVSVYDNNQQEKLLSLGIEFIEMEKSMVRDFFDQMIKATHGQAFLRDLFDVSFRSIDRAVPIFHAAYEELFSRYREETMQLFDLVLEGYCVLLEQQAFDTVLPDWQYVLELNGSWDSCKRIELQLTQFLNEADVERCKNLLLDSNTNILVSTIMTVDKEPSELLTFIKNSSQWKQQPTEMAFPNVSGLTEKAKENLFVSTSMIFLEASEIKQLPLVGGYIQSSGMELEKWVAYATNQSEYLVEKVLCLCFILSDGQQKIDLDVLLHNKKKSAKMAYLTNVQRLLKDAGLVTAYQLATNYKEHLIIDHQSPMLRKVKQIMNKLKRNEN